MFCKSKYGLLSVLTMASTAFVAGAVVYTLSKRRDIRRLSKSADEGYETAFDLIYPNMRVNTRQKLKYGPTF